MTGTLYVNLRCNNGEIVMVSRKKFEIYDDEWDMLSTLQRDYGCLPWRKVTVGDNLWTFKAELSEDYGAEYFIAEFKPNNQ